MSLTLRNVLIALKPIDIWGWWLYVIVVFVGITMLLQRQGSPLLGTIMLAGSIMSALLLKIQAFYVNSFPSFFFAIILWVFPLVVIGMTKSPKSRLPGGIAAFLGAVFMFAKWATMPK